MDNRKLNESSHELKKENVSADTKLLQNISTELIWEDNRQSLYEKIMDTAVKIMHSEYASLQMLINTRGSIQQLQLLAYRGFNERAATFWSVTNVDHPSTCGVALQVGHRVIVPLSRQAEGTGIGLSLVRFFVEALGGNVSVKSKVGRGSTFIIQLPTEKAPDEAYKKQMPDLLNNHLIHITNVEFSDIYL